MQDLNSVISLVENLLKGSGPGANEVTSYSPLMKRILARCAMFCKAEVTKPVRKKGKPVTMMTETLYGRDAAVALVKDLQERQKKATEEITLIHIGPVYRFRWLLPPDQLASLEIMKRQSVQSEGLKILKVRAIADKADAGDPVVAGVAPAGSVKLVAKNKVPQTPVKAPEKRPLESDEPMTSLANLKSPTGLPALKKPKTVVDETPLLRFFGAKPSAGSKSAASSPVPYDADDDVS